MMVTMARTPASVALTALALVGLLSCSPGRQPDAISRSLDLRTPMPGTAIDSVIPQDQSRSGGCGQYHWQVLNVDSLPSLFDQPATAGAVEVRYRLGGGSR
jgi:hypothetical protein